VGFKRCLQLFSPQDSKVSAFNGKWGTLDKKNRSAASLLLVGLLLTVAALAFFQVAEAQDVYSLSMPEEYLKYTVTMENGSLWVKIDGTYPMHLTASNATSELPMYYPTPPNTTNMHVYLDGDEQPWSNYSEIDPSALHYTDIGDWQMIYTVVTPQSPDFVLAIHYEHPVQVINGTYTFLYDLNIEPYLSAATPKSTAHFTINLDTADININVYTTGHNGTWSPFSFNTTKEGSTQTASFDIVSEYDKPLWGDIAMTLTTSQPAEFPFWPVLLLLIFIVMLVVVFVRKVKLKKTSD